MINFQPIDRNNYMDCICLKVKENQTSFVADNARSLVEAHFEEGLYTRAIYNDNLLVGFVLYDYDPEIPGWSMSRFMIDAQYQGQGIGKLAVIEFLKYIKEELHLTELYISVEMENTVALEMYRKIGFTEVKPISYTFDGVTYYEIQMKIKL